MHNADRPVADRIPDVAMTMACYYDNFVDPRRKQAVNTTFDEGFAGKREKLFELSHSSRLARRKKNR
jgi:hypothetical protein